jgi:hypothetical protein
LDSIVALKGMTWVVKDIECLDRYAWMIPRGNGRGNGRGSGSIYVFAVGFSLFRTYHLTRSSVATESSTEE